MIMNLIFGTPFGKQQGITITGYIDKMGKKKLTEKAGLVDQYTTLRFWETDMLDRNLGFRLVTLFVPSRPPPFSLSAYYLPPSLVILFTYTLTHSHTHIDSSPLHQVEILFFIYYG